MIYQDLIDKRTMDKFESFRQALHGNVIGLPNITISRSGLQGVVAWSTKLIPELLMDNRKIIVLGIDSDQDRNILSWILRSIPIALGDWMEVVTDGKATFLILLCGTTLTQEAFRIKYENILGKRSGVLGFSDRSKGFAEVLTDYRRVTTDTNRVCDQLVERISDTITVHSRRDFEVNSLEYDGYEFTYRVMAGKAGGVGIIAGNMGSGIWMCATKKTPEFRDSYPVSLGRLITDSKAKVPVSKQVLELSIGDVVSWIDDRTTKYAPFNYRSKGSVVDSAMGSVYSLHNYKPIINIRM